MKVENGGFYRHFKGGLYQVLCTARHTESDEELVIYQALYGTFEIFARPFKEFCEMLDRKKYPDSPQAYRFVQIDREAVKGEKTDISDTEKNSDIRDTAEETREESASAEEAVPFIMQFLEAGSSQEKLDLIRLKRNSIDERTIANIEASLDVVSDSDDLDTRIGYICDVLRTRSKYENSRLRG